MRKINILFLSFLFASLFMVSCTDDDDDDDDQNPVVADFEYAPSDSNPLEVSFTNASENAVSYAWDFGDNNTSTEENPVHEYAASGTFTVQLTATGSDESTDTKSKDVTVEGAAGSEFDLVIEYLEDTGGNPVNTYPVMITAATVYANIQASADQYIIDIRSADDYAAGHIEGAENVAAADVLTHYETNSLQDVETVVIVCYSGQSAGWVNGLMHAAGYTNTKDMKWGMCSWNSTTSGSWVNNIGDDYAALLTTEVTDKAEAGDYPTLNTGATTAQEILSARVAEVFTEGFAEAKTTSATVFGAPENYYIVNYWSETDYSWNHIPGAVQYTPKETLTSDTFLNTLPTDKPVAVYCYTGQTSAHVAAYLRVLGYDAQSIVFGVNGMAHSTMPGTTFDETTEVNDYPLVTD